MCFLGLKGLFRQQKAHTGKIHDRGIPYRRHCERFRGLVVKFGVQGFALR